MASIQKITPCLWFDQNGKEAAEFYCSLFPNSKIVSTTPLVTEFLLNGQKFMTLNGGPRFKFTEAISLMVNCDDQAEVDFFWEKLTENGGEESMCGWLKDKYGLSWQIVPKQLMAIMSTGTPEQQKRAMDAFSTMRKLEMATIEKAFKGL
jgi:predicted 3-demethylubiquinone-9 3-methyltransferase (glyoxalase superfamily)